MSGPSLLALQVEARHHERNRHCPGCPTGAVDPRTCGVVCLRCWLRVPRDLRIQLLNTDSQNPSQEVLRLHLLAAYQVRGWLAAHYLHDEVSRPGDPTGLAGHLVTP